MNTDERWYQKAVFYEVLTRGFFDANNDGTGDLKGLTEKLDYLEWLGVDVLWLLPFYQSPLRDGGYDISDFFTVLPEYGDLADVVELVEQTHRRGMRVIADLVINHTSDQHPWFQESRQDRTNPKADWYVWNDDDQRFPDARIIFVDTERSNWSWDPVRQQYFWHRFFSHQPDLNFDNEEVQQAILDVVRFWLDLGLDGFRLDAVPYLFERDGTNGENLPETHDYLKRLRKEVESTHPNTVLLAEANQWPTDVVDYFGSGDECHMAFHFPLMPRMFMAVRREQRYPITEILAQTPDIPDGAQWGIFLRNHDELTLEMVTDEERDYMYAEYAKDPRMKRNIGIGRRFATLVDNDRRVSELLHGLLFSLPGSPVLYYGDEIGMGDNIYLGDRDGVRTPMQWTPDRNAGFSKGDFAQLYLPPLMDPVYGYQSVNVEAGLRDPGSFLHWLQRTLRVRRQHSDVFGVGSFDVLSAENPSVLAFLRHQGDETILCVNNLSRFAQPVELQLGRFAGKTPIELFGRVPFPKVGELPYLLTLGGHGFYWFQLSTDEPMSRPLPSIPLELLRAHLPRQRWYAGTAEPVSLTVSASEVLRDGWPLLVRLLVAADGSCYQVLLGLRPVAEQLDFLRGHDDAAVGVVDVDGETATVYDAALDPDLGLHLYWHVTGGDESAERVRPIGVEQSNTSLVYDERVILKVFRRLLAGPNPEVEVTSALSQVGFPWVAEPLATETAHGYDLAFLQPFLAGAVDGWALALTSLRDLFGVHDTQSIPVLDLSVPPPPTDPAEAGGDFSAEAGRLGETTAAMHVAMAEAFGRAPGDTREWADVIEAHARRALGDVVPALAILEELRLADAGPAIRAHGDYHLGQVMRTDAGWYVLDFEGEPDRPLEERQRRTSPLRDVAGMLRSLHYASAVARAERDGHEFDESAEAWEARNRQAFLDGYLPAAAKAGILPADQSSIDAVLAAFELEKAVYELAYERSHRPEWEHIPVAALRRLGVGRR